MRTQPRARATLGVVALAVTLLIPATAYAVEGPPPPSQEHRVVARTHTDAVATTLEGGELVLASRADLPEGNGTALDPASTLFHVDDASLVTVPAGNEFVAPEGASVWITPESNPSGPDGYGQLWPGFSTESVAPSGVDGDSTTFALTAVEAPEGGSVEVWRGAGAGLTRMWSSDEPDFSEFTIGRTHMHANWAFTQPGTYRLTVEARAAVGGSTVSDTATYTFVVGPLAAPVVTSTELRVNALSAVQGQSVELSVLIDPYDATGWVEFFDGDEPLGHTAVTDGYATFTVASLPLGQRSITARFSPTSLNDHAPSTSPVRRVTVTEQIGGEEFGIVGLAPEYQAGEEIVLRAAGVTLKEGEYFWWVVRNAENPGGYVASHGDSSLPGNEYRRDATTALDGSEISLQVRGPKDGRDATLQTSGWETINVTGPDVGSGAPLGLAGVPDSAYYGDPIAVTADHAPLTDGQEYRWVARSLPGGIDWTVPYEDLVPMPGSTPGEFILNTDLLGWNELALQIVDADGAVVGQSPAVSPTMTSRELALSGVRSVYRADDVLTATSDLYPARDDVKYQWTLAMPGSWFEPIEGANSPTISFPVTAEHEGARLQLDVTDLTTGASVAYSTANIRVTDAAPGEQLVLLDSLAGHYHQGYTVELHASADPVASDTDTYRWFWQRPDQADWSQIPGFTTDTHELRAQQALDGTLVRAELVTADGTVLGTSETVTIEVDDHGSAPAEKATLEGSLEYAAGEPLDLSAVVDPDSVLERWEWYVLRSGEQEAELLTESTDARLELDATTDLDGASVFARLTFDDGRTYVETAPVVLAVSAAADPGTDPLPVPDPAPVPDPGPVTAPDPGLPPAPGTSPQPGGPEGSVGGTGDLVEGPVTAKAATAAPSTSPGDALPVTGTSPGALALAGGTVLAIGAALLLTARTRRRPAR